MFIEVFDKGKHEDDIIGGAEVPLDTVIAEGKHSCVVQLNDKKNRPAGNVSLILTMHAVRKLSNAVMIELCGAV